MKTFLFGFISFSLMISATLSKEINGTECDVTIADTIYYNKQIIVTFNPPIFCENAFSYEAGYSIPIGAPLNYTMFDGMVIFSLPYDLCGKAYIFITTLDENDENIGFTDIEYRHGDAVEDLTCNTDSKKVTCNWKQPTPCRDFDVLTYKVIYYNGLGVTEENGLENEEYSFSTQYCSDSWLTVAPVYDNNWVGYWQIAKAC